MVEKASVVHFGTAFAPVRLILLGCAGYVASANAAAGDTSRPAAATATTFNLVERTVCLRVGGISRRLRRRALLVYAKLPSIVSNALSRVWRVWVRGS